MKLAGFGRILFWHGGSLWIGRSERPSDFHSHHALQISLAFSEDGLRLRCPEENWKTYTAAIVTTHQTHAFEATGKHVGTIFVEPESKEGQLLRQNFPSKGIIAVANGTIESEKLALHNSYLNGASDEELICGSRAVITTLIATGLPVEVTLDRRITQALTLIRERINETIRLADIADAACLSPDRFRHLFVKETGIRFRPYILWLKIEIALTAYVANQSLTEAAYAGGFADAAHFSRTFKRMFGFSPSSIQIE